MVQYPLTLLNSNSAAAVVVCSSEVANAISGFFNFFFSIHLVGGGVQLGPLSMAATDWPIVACPG
jgi:hypothetical protein